MEPITTSLILSSIVSLMGQGLGGALNYSANKAAQEEARALDERNFAETQKMNRFSMDMSKKGLALSKQQQALNENRFAEEKKMNAYNITQNQLKQIEGFLNTNLGLKNFVLSRWGGAR